MNAIEVAVPVGVAVLGGQLIAPRLRMPVPLAQLILGVAVGFLPAARPIELPSEVVLLLFLPGLIFWESLTTPLREVRRSFRGILLISTLLVAATAFGVAGVAVALGLPWGIALILGAALAPSDATAVGTMSRSLPYRNMVLLRAESLLNDGAAIVIYTIAVALTVNHVAYTGWQVTGLVALAYVGGVAVGLGFGWGSTVLLRQLPEALGSSTVLVVVPFAAYLLAETIGASGVIAVVTAGLFLTQRGPSLNSPQVRQLSTGFWTLSTSILGGSLFVLIGIELHAAVRGVAADLVLPLMLLAVAAWVCILVIRFVFQVAFVVLIRLVYRRPSQRQRRMPMKTRILSTVAGFRGAVSIAVALAVPALSPIDGSRVAGRDEIVFVAAIVVLLTLVVQGTALPHVIRWANLPADSSVADELVMARKAATEDAQRAAPGLAEKMGIPSSVLEQVLLQDRERQFPADSEDGSEASKRAYASFRLALVEHQRRALIELLDRQVIGDGTLQAMQLELDQQALLYSDSGQAE